MGFSAVIRIGVRSCLISLALGVGSAQALVLAVNEGVTYRVPLSEIRARYEAIAADLSKLLHQSVSIEPVGDYRTLRAGLAEHRWELALVHPAHVSIQAIKQSDYRLVAVTKGFTGYKASFLVRADSPLKALAELKGLRIGAPDEDSITAVMMRATLRDAGVPIVPAVITYTRYQDAVPFFVENRLTHVGVTAASAVIKDWQAKGGRVMASSTAVPIKHIIASPALSAEQFEKVQAYLVGLDGSDEGKKKLEPTKWKGFELYDQAALLKLGAWLGL
ncbi:PhnD/SsuA/transferrin family substrate-binding protein [Paucibacter sp. APW11]|uniref:PhnD/SsuA/transferrin family substrate-binding protein n=1 Tax=Roseateles aquae TaxID=3077235 RepID=A0ABU3PCU2_9BURK|nr:PhnD/SsuA/transferrin family substrate-binding protein [Paucibacter sp. APW11]MDT9000385.1 PhnD/SsuA/transferrin family substrate-binding protein [Paucibacter sp. APW11]